MYRNEIPPERHENVIIVEREYAIWENPPVSVPAGSSLFSKIRFKFGNEWEDMERFAQLTQGETAINCKIEGDVLFIPPELKPNRVYIQVFGYENGSLKKAVSNKLCFAITPGISSEADPAVPPKPDLYQKLIGEYEDKLANSLQEAKDSGEFDGAPGYTPIKGVDYFDGAPGYTPIKGVDYFDGAPGRDGLPGRDGVDGKDGAPGKDGYTPIKGVDYFDGEDGKTLIHVGSDEPAAEDVIWIDVSDEKVYPDAAAVRKAIGDVTEIKEDLTRLYGTAQTPLTEAQQAKIQEAIGILSVEEVLF